MMEQHVHCKLCGREVTPARYGLGIICPICVTAMGGTTIKEKPPVQAGG